VTRASQSRQKSGPKKTKKKAGRPGEKPTFFPTCFWANQRTPNSKKGDPNKAQKTKKAQIRAEKKGNTARTPPYNQETV